MTTLTASLQKRLARIGIASKVENDSIIIFGGVRTRDGARMVCRIHEAERADLKAINSWAWQADLDRRRR